MNSEMLLDVRRLVRAYREGDSERRVLNGLDLQLAQGECVALLGRSGCGKSTLLNLLAGIDLPDAGEILIGQRPLHALSERDRTLFRRRHIGFVYQFFNLIPTLTVAENTGLPLALNGSSDDEVDRRVNQLLDEIGLLQRGRDFPDRLSGGEQQRVAVARALIHRPALILADEPTGNLDAESGGRVLELLTGLSRRQGRSLVIVTHSMVVADVADRVLTLEDGRLEGARGQLAW
jgi:putative ABC transport system ATP-binding protein